MKAIFIIFVLIVAIIDVLLMYAAGRLNKEREGEKNDHERKIVDDSEAASKDDR